MANKITTKKAVKKTVKRKAAVKTTATKKWVYLFQEVKAAEPQE